jgi:hypothetical protein
VGKIDHGRIVLKTIDAMKRSDVGGRPTSITGGAFVLQDPDDDLRFWACPSAVLLEPTWSVVPIAPGARTLVRGIFPSGSRKRDLAIPTFQVH